MRTGLSPKSILAPPVELGLLLIAAELELRVSELTALEATELAIELTTELATLEAGTLLLLGRGPESVDEFAAALDCEVSPVELEVSPAMDEFATSDAEEKLSLLGVEEKSSLLGVEE